MAWNLGLLGAAGAGGGAVPAFDLLSTSVLGTTTSSVTFSSLNTLAADYKHLEIRMTGRSTIGFDIDRYQIQVNGVTSEVYTFHNLEADGGSIGSGRSPSIPNNRFAIDALTGATSSAGQFGATIFRIYDFSSSTKNTTFAGKGGKPLGNNTVKIASGLFNNTAAITSIKIECQASLAENSRFSIYGIRG